MLGATREVTMDTAGLCVQNDWLCIFSREAMRRIKKGASEGKVRSI